VPVVLNLLFILPPPHRSNDLLRTASQASDACNTHACTSIRTTAMKDRRQTSGESSHFSSLSVASDIGLVAWSLGQVGQTNSGGHRPRGHCAASPPCSRKRPDTCRSSLLHVWLLLAIVPTTTINAHHGQTHIGAFALPASPLPPPPQARGPNQDPTPTRAKTTFHLTSYFCRSDSRPTGGRGIKYLTPHLATMPGGGWSWYLLTI